MEFRRQIVHLSAHVSILFAISFPSLPFEMGKKRKFITLCFGEYRYVALQRVLSAHYRIEPFECSSGTRIAAINDWAVRAVEDAYIAYPLGE